MLLASIHAGIEEVRLKMSGNLQSYILGSQWVGGWVGGRVGGWVDGWMSGWWVIEDEYTHVIHRGVSNFGGISFPFWGGTPSYSSSKFE